MHVPDDRHLDPAKLISTSNTLAGWIDRDFNHAHLSVVAANVQRLTQEAVVTAERIRRPIWPLRVGIWGLCLVFVAGAVHQLVSHRFDEVLHFLDETKGAVLYLGGFLLGFITLEVRLKRRRAIKAVNELRAVAHIVDMHQLAKDQAIGEFREQTSPEKMESYLHACIALLALLSKIGQLYVEHFPDTVATQAVNEFEMIATGLSNKIWMKILSLQRLEGTLPQHDEEATPLKSR
jgi:hypothetical protein